ncbi:MAG: heme-binding protein [Cyclobacterium sp.]|uniref:heme-binding protein n=1 Tax=unclassified Cyclobacterium TaxID=2615055 RepID=UPI0013D1BBD1|nr:heme-binding protein [Cyclobacterium sp. SYSU L10401]
MLTTENFKEMLAQGRTLKHAPADEDALGPLKQLTGVWTNVPHLPGHGWNMIALPFIKEGSSLNYRLLLNQYNEKNAFGLVDKGVPNRGVDLNEPENTDQFVATLDYDQSITQIAAMDFPESGEAGPPDLPIHHEPGLFLHMTNLATTGFDIARLGSIPHGNSVLALGKARTIDGAPTIPQESGLPLGFKKLDNPYLAPYKHFHENLFKGVFDPTIPNDLLTKANEGVAIVKTTELTFDSTFESGGISSIPFIKKQANATKMNATFWIQELADKDSNGDPILRLQYTQTVILNFFGIDWPHVSVNTLQKVV